MGNRGDIGDARHLQTRSLEGSDRRLSSASWTGNLDIDLSQTVLLGSSRSLVSRDLSCERSAFSASLKVRIARAGPRDHVALRVGDRDQRIVE